MSSSFNEEESEVFSAPFAMTDIELQAGIVAGQYSCEYQGSSGTLYAGSKALYFVGSYFLFDKKLLLPWEIVRQVVKLDRGVLIETAKKGEDPRQYSFGAMHQPARIWPILIELHNDAILDRPCVPTRARVDSMEPLLKRRNSDPLQQYQNRPLIDESMFEEEDRAFLEASKNDLFGDEQDQEKKKQTETPLQSFMAKVSKTSSTSSTSSSSSPSSTVLGLTVQEVDEKLGELRYSAIPCTYDSVKGNLYAGNKSLYFYGKKYFWDIRKLFVPVHTVKQIKLFHDPSSEDTDRKSTGIVVSDQFEQVYYFDCMDNADEVWAELLYIHNENLKRSRPSLSRGIDTSRHGSLKRMNSDPDLAASRATPDKGRTIISTGKFSPELPLKKRDLAHQDTDPTSNKSTKPHIAKSIAKEDFDEKAEWEKALKRQQDYPNLVVENMRLSCSMDEFVGHFFADNAPHSIPRFLESRGDSSLETSAWKSVSTSESHHRTRVVHYKHPVNAPLAPPQAGARKEQTMIRYGALGLCLESRTIVDDVPMADCFHVDDRIRVQPDGANSVLINMEFEISFVKSTLFKSIISKTTKSEFTDLFQAMGNYMTEALKGGPPPVAARASLRGGASVDVPSVDGTYDLMTRSLTTVHPMVTLLVLLLQIYLIYEVKSMRLDMGSQNSTPRSCIFDAASIARFENLKIEEAL